MGAVEFTSRLVGQLLSWPVVVLILAFMFRTPLRDLIARLRTYKGLGQELTFGEQLAETEESVHAAVESVATPARDADSHESVTPDVEDNPAFAIISAWEALVADIEALVKAIRGGEAVPRRPFITILEDLRHSGVVNERFVQAVTELRLLRNRVAHGKHNPTAGEALAYVESAQELRRAASALALVAPHAR